MGFIGVGIKAIMNQRDFGARPPIIHFAEENQREFGRNWSPRYVISENRRLIPNAMLRVAGICLGV